MKNLMQKISPLWAPEGEGNGAAAAEGAGEGTSEGEGGDNVAKTTTTEGEAVHPDPTKVKEGETKAEPTPPPEPLTAESLTFPEGVQINEELRDKFLGWVNERHLSADDANTLVALQADVMKAASERNSALWDEQVGEWKKATEALPEIGGAKLPETLGEIRKMLDTYGTPELEAALDLTGLGNHPELVKLFHRIAVDLGEGKPLQGLPPGQGERTAAQILFPNQGKQ